MKRKFSVLLIYTMAAFVAAAAQATPRSIDKKKYYELFLGYRNALADPNANCSSYFSSELNETWIGYLLANKSTDELVSRLHAVRSRYRFGDDVAAVYAYTAEQLQPREVRLIVVYRNAADRRIETLQITYVTEGGRERIASLHFDATAPRHFRAGPSINDFVSPRGAAERGL